MVSIRSDQRVCPSVSRTVLFLRLLVCPRSGGRGVLVAQNQGAEELVKQFTRRHPIRGDRVEVLGTCQRSPERSCRVAVATNGRGVRVGGVTPRSRLVVGRLFHPSR